MMPIRTVPFLLVLNAISCVCGAEIDFSRDIRPILAANCFQCHGADAQHREADLRLDTFDGATVSHVDHAAIVPGKPELSELIRRIRSSDPDLKMPPPETGKTISPEQIQLLSKWIAEGAVYQQHWAFTAPVRPHVPDVDDPWIRNPIDRFVLQKLNEVGLKPTATAEPAALLRRLSLDLIGLPPTPAEIHTFENEISRSPSGRESETTKNSPDEDLSFNRAWQQQIERLLSSRHYGEKWGRHWLDAARYADSDGFEKDKPRFVWFYRDWVVNALNQDQPYNQFLIEQIAGDLLPDRTQDQLVATGFLRNSMINEEGGVDPEQFRMEAMFDRMDAIGRGMLGLTIQCAQCHDHKYDPFSQHDYFRLFAFLNNCHEAQATVYTTSEQQTRSRILTETAALENQLRDQHPDWPSRLESWARSLEPRSGSWSVVRPELDASGGQKHYLLDDGSILAQGYAPTKHTTEFSVETDLQSLTGFRLELLNDPNLPHGGPGRAIDGLCALSEFQVRVAPRESPSTARDVRLVAATADVSPAEKELAAIFHDKSDKRRVTGPIEFAIDGDNLTAWGIDDGGGRSNVPRNAVFRPDQPLQSSSGFRITFRLVQMHGGWNSDDNQNNNLGRFRFSVTSEPDPTADTIPAEVRNIAQKRPADRTARETQQLFSVWRRTVAEFENVNQQIETLWKQHPRGTTQLVLQERAERRPTYLLTRGDFLKPADRVEPGIPQMFRNARDIDGRTPNLADTQPLSQRHGSSVPARLQFARWLASAESPTTARAAVNRIWQEYFGTGIVETSEDFGTQGAYPSHPELLDWLAVELIDSGWSLKHIHRLIVQSATYQQSSAVTPDLLEKDPQNRLLARGARFRVHGEIVRDIFLQAAGLLNPETGGPSVYPPAPEFLFLPPASYGPKTWDTASGADRYRRGLYTFRFRSVPYPVLQNFDTPRGDTACIRRSRSNTPLQALTTLNEELFMDCSRALGKAVLAECSGDDRARIDFLMRRCVSRPANQQEHRIMQQFVADQRLRFSELEKSDQRQMILLTGGTDKADPLSEKVSGTELAVWTATARVILNLDETITRN